MAGAGQDLATLARYTAWANTRLYDALCRLSAAQLTAPTPIFAGSILRTLNHVRLIDVVWQSHLLGVPHGFTTRNPEAAPELEALRQAQQTLDAWYVDYASALDARQCVEVVRFTFIGGGDGTMTRAEIVAHIVNHTTYHRGHTGAMLNLAGINPPTTDLTVFLRAAARTEAPGQAGPRSGNMARPE